MSDFNGAQAGTTKLIDAPSRAFHRDPGGDRGLTSRILSLCRGQYLTHDHLGDATGLDACPLQRGFDGDRPEIVGRHGGESTVETSNGGAGVADDDNIV